MKALIIIGIFTLAIVLGVAGALFLGWLVWLLLGVILPAFGITAPGYWVCVAIVLLFQIIGGFFRGSK